MYLIGYCLTLIIGATSASNPLVRDDGTCGSSNPLGDGSPSQCNPGYCCSEWGHCGNTPSHCDCSACVRYDNMESSDTNTPASTLKCPVIEEQNLAENLEANHALNDSSIFDVGFTLTYTCKNNKEIVNTKDSDDVAPTLNSVCQSDGQWSKDILNYQCLECDKLQPATGFFQCDTKNMAAESSCHFKCPLGLLPGGERKTTCKKTIDEIDNSTSFNWDKDVSDFGCVSTISMLVGGISDKNLYLDDVELYAPGLPCHQAKLPPFPVKVIGATGNMVGSGKIVICGGAQQKYTGCTGSLQRDCTKNVECVTTDGGTKWCFGSRSKDCYTYDTIQSNPAEKWKKIALMKSGRAYSSSVVLPDGRLWITGGLDDESILETTEILEETKDGKWIIYEGPNLPKPLFGHCLEVLRNGRVLLAGGFDGSDQADITEEFEWVGTDYGKWSSKAWSPMKYKRFDHSCFSKDGGVEIVGGWSEDFAEKLKSERYNETARRWEIIDDAVNSELPDILRSSSIGVSEGNIALIGGVKCSIDNPVSGKKTCEKHSEVYELEPNVAENRKEWKKKDKKIGTPRSSHIIINVPKSIDFSCDPIEK